MLDRYKEITLLQYRIILLSISEYVLRTQDMHCLRIILFYGICLRKDSVL